MAQNLKKRVKIKASVYLLSISKISLKSFFFLNKNRVNTFYNKNHFFNKIFTPITILNNVEHVRKLAVNIIASVSSVYNIEVIYLLTNTMLNAQYFGIKKTS